MLDKIKNITFITVVVLTARLSCAPLAITAGIPQTVQSLMSAIPLKRGFFPCSETVATRYSTKNILCLGALLVTSGWLAWVLRESPEKESPEKTVLNTLVRMVLDGIKNKPEQRVYGNERRQLTKEQLMTPLTNKELAELRRFLTVLRSACPSGLKFAGHYHCSIHGYELCIMYRRQGICKLAVLPDEIIVVGFGSLTSSGYISPSVRLRITKGDPGYQELLDAWGAAGYPGEDISSNVPKPVISRESRSGYDSM